MLWICATDGVPFSVGAPKCPHCGGTTFREQGDEDGPIRSTETGEPVEEKAQARAKKSTADAGDSAQSVP